MSKAKQPSNAAQDFERALKNLEQAKYVLTLYVAGDTAKSRRAIANLRAQLEKHLKGRYELEIIDISDKPLLARDEQIIAAPTLVKSLPLPIRRLIGDMAETEHIQVGLDLKPAEQKPAISGKGKPSKHGEQAAG